MMKKIFFINTLIIVFVLSAIAQNDKDEEKMITSAAKGEYSKVVSMIKKGTNINAKNRARWNALAYACKYGHGNIVKYLVEHGADVNQTVNVGSTPLQVSLNKNYYNIADYLIRNGADVNIPDITGMTALAWAAKSGDLKTVKYLVDKGADVNSKNVSSRTVLDTTIDTKVKQYLKTVGAKTGKELMES